ncbi:hypothetical protein QTP88_011300 [Uroleucon formosanum]
MEPSPSNHNIYKVDSICYTKIKIEAPHPKKNPVQCLRCQNYGHTRTYCHHTPRCVKCGDIHLSSECQKDSNTPATCALCSGDHTASYKGCSKFKLLQKGRSSIKTNRPTETQDSSSTSIKTNTIHENNFPPLCQPQWNTSQSTTIQNLPNTHSHPKKNQNLTEPCVNPNHTAVLLSLNTTTPTNVKHSLARGPISWTKFKDILDNKTILKIPLKNAHDIEVAALMLTNNIQSAIFDSSSNPNKSTKPKNIPKILNEMLAQKRRARARWQSTRHPLDKHALNSISNRLKK